MLGLNKRENRIFKISVMGHLVLATGIVFFAFIPSCEEKPEEVHVFELASSPPVLAPAILPPRPTPPVKKVIPKPKPTPPPTPKPKPVVVKKKTPPPKKPTPSPLPKKIVPTPSPKTPTKPKAISIEQFRKSQNLPSSTPNRPKVQALQPIQIDPKNYSLPKIKVTQNNTVSSSVSANAVNQYLARVKAQLEGIWRKLLRDAALNNGGEARLSFRISSKGTIVSPRLSLSSGNPALDRLVFEVSRRAGNFGTPPGGKLDSTLEIPFRVN